MPSGWCRHHRGVVGGLEVAGIQPVQRAPDGQGDQHQGAERQAQQPLDRPFGPAGRADSVAPHILCQFVHRQAPSKPSSKVTRH